MAHANFITLFNNLPSDINLEENYLVYEFDHVEGGKKSLLAEIILMNGKPIVRAYIKRTALAPHGTFSLVTVPNAFAPVFDFVKPYPWSELS